MLLHIATYGALFTPPAGVVLFGPGSNEVKLITAKLAARAGFSASYICGAGEEQTARALLYGKDYANAGVDEPGNVQLVVTSEQISAALNECAALVVVADNSPVTATAVPLLVDNAPKLERVALLSKCGTTRATAGFLGLGKGDVEIREGEERLAAALKARDVPLSVVRVGALKGGGPGAVEGGSVVDGVDKGLAKYYYDTLYELETAMTTQSYDKFTNGAALAAGDAVDPRPPPLQMATRGSFDAREDEASRVVAANCLLAALRQPAATEVTLSAAKAPEPPTDAEWDALFAAA